MSNGKERFRNLTRKKTPAERVGEQVAAQVRTARRRQHSLYGVEGVDWDTHTASSSPPPRRPTTAPRGKQTVLPEGQVVDDLLDRLSKGKKPSS